MKLNEIVERINTKVQKVDKQYRVVEDCGLSLKFVPNDGRKPFPIAWFTYFIKDHYICPDTPVGLANTNLNKVQDVFYKESIKQLHRLGAWTAVDYVRQV